MHFTEGTICCELQISKQNWISLLQDKLQPNFQPYIRYYNKKTLAGFKFYSVLIIRDLIKCKLMRW